MTIAADQCILIEAERTTLVESDGEEIVVSLGVPTLTLVDANLDTSVQMLTASTVVDIQMPLPTVVWMPQEGTTVVDFYTGVPGPSKVSSDTGNVAVLGSDGLIYVPEGNVPYDREIDESQAGSGVTYIGEAEPGTASSDQAWRIKRITEAATATSIDWAGGVADTVYAWDDRLTLPYGP